VNACIPKRRCERDEPGGSPPFDSLAASVFGFSTRKSFIYNYLKLALAINKVFCVVVAGRYLVCRFFLKLK
jgi:hypothetical protein